MKFHRGDVGDCSLLLETMVQRSSRWKWVRLNPSSHCSLEPLAMLSSTDTLILETIIIENRPDAFDWSTVSFLRTPSLRNVTLRYAGNCSNFALPWSRLSHLSPGQITLAEGSELLRRCPSLATCVLRFNRRENDSASSLPVCRMEHLRRLSVVDREQGMGEFIQHLDLPSMHTLEYSAPDPLRFPLASILVISNRLQCLRLCVQTMVSSCCANAPRAVSFLTVFPWRMSFGVP
ncbi:hypothetical protein DFH06DRAFT_507663 [Mycena polygramma]|nr:hypothetical protein DFH06DRAFT_507663 [Mycena polygramma]